ncbi:MAG: sulfite exporter TauE/SafE family protein [Bryobacteraceae bacterium]|nr:sulfite exporter TauE/SafE family protein [Bryobacteraceae bacterium]
MYFPISGVEVSPLVPPLVAFAIASLVTSAGVSGAFLILPFQMSVLGFTSPAVSATNLLYNVVAIPGGVSQYIREGRMAWPIAWTTLAGTLPGIFIGAIVRVRYLPGGRAAKFFVGLVLLWLGYRLLSEFFGRVRAVSPQKRAIEAKFDRRLPKDAIVETRSVSVRRIEYAFWGESFAFSPVALFALAFAVGIAGGIYGIGGGAIIAPFVVSVLHLPVYTVAGAALFGTFVTSIVGVGFFELLAMTPLSSEAPVRPDWLLGLLFGLGGLAGTFVGARLQKYLPERWIRLFLGFLVTGIAVSYVWQFFA